MDDRNSFSPLFESLLESQAAVSNAQTELGNALRKQAGFLCDFIAQISGAFNDYTKLNVAAIESQILLSADRHIQDAIKAMRITLERSTDIELLTAMCFESSDFKAMDEIVTNLNSAESLVDPVRASIMVLRNSPQVVVRHTYINECFLDVLECFGRNARKALKFLQIHYFDHKLFRCIFDHLALAQAELERLPARYKDNYQHVIKNSR